MNGYILDSNVFLWWLTAEPRLVASGWYDRIEQLPKVAISLATPWEIWIKAASGKLPQPPGFDAALEEANLTILTPTLADARLAAHLPRLHGDPFDRMIIGQALNRQMTVVTSDRIFADYGVEVALV